VPTMNIEMKDLPDSVRAAVRAAVKGTEVVISADGVPAVRLAPVTPRPTKPRVLGMHPGAMIMRDDFDAYVDVEDFLRGDI
jgi:antitoxin (DNA-binding transcriptional repressor) of toxin-antitoxin stability system